MAENVLNIRSNERFLTSLRIVIPFLAQVPDPIYYQLDSSQFVLPKGNIARLRVMLEDEIGHFVMTYRADTFNLTIPLERHLCAVLAGAELTAEQITLLQHYEARTKPNGISLVVYKRPLELINSRESWLFENYF